MTDICGILASSATQWYQDVAPTQEFFFVVTSGIYGEATLKSNCSMKKLCTVVPFQKRRPSLLWVTLEGRQAKAD